jgi:hypothetical protein
MEQADYAGSPGPGHVGYYLGLLIGCFFRKR